MENIKLKNWANMLKMLERSGVEYAISFDNNGAVMVCFTGKQWIAYCYGSLDNRFDSKRVVYFGHDWEMFSRKVLEKIQQIRGCGKNESL